MLGAPCDLHGLDAHLPQFAQQLLARHLHVVLAVGAALVDHLLDLGVALGVQRLERQVLEFPLERVDTQTVGQRGVHLEGLAGLLHLLRLAHVLQGAHVVQAVGQLHQQHADVARHRHDELAVVLGLPLLLALEVDARELGDPLHQRGHLGPELLLHLLARGGGVLHRVVQQRGLDGLVVQTEPRTDARAAERMGDVGLARVPQLVAVLLVGERVGAPDGVGIGIRVIDQHLAHQRLEFRGAGGR